MNIFTVVVILPAGFYPICSCAKQSSVRSLVSKYNPDRCWINENIQETDVPGVCPLWDTNFKISVYCSISLSPYRMDNERCRRCVWKENTEKLCRPTKHWQRRTCCCKRPMCNKIIWEDAMPGWHMTTDKINHYNISFPMHKSVCIKAMFNGKEGWTKNQKTKQTYELVASKNEEEICFLNVTKGREKDQLIHLEMGLATGPVRNRCLDFTQYHGKCYQPNKTANSTLCCCRKKFCNQELYMRAGFDQVMNFRLAEEIKYKKNMTKAAAKIPKKFWFKDEAYYNAKPYVDSFLIIGTSIYILVITIIYRLYKPIDMDKRKRPDTASKEITYGSIEMIEAKTEGKQ